MKNFLTSCLGVLAALTLFLIIAPILIFTSIKPSPSKVVENAVLRLTLKGGVAEHTTEDPLNFLEKISSSSDAPIGLPEFRRVIAHAKTDDNIKGIYLDLREVGSIDLGVLSEVRASLIDFRKSGKWVLAYSRSLGLGGYYLASASDKIYLHPEGDLILFGISVRPWYMKKMFEKLKIKPQIFRVGSYKSAVEPLIRENMSAEDRLQRSQLIESIYGELNQQMAEARGLDAKRLRGLVDSALVRTPHDAVAYKLIDSLYYEDQLTSNLQVRLGLDEDEDVEFVSFGEYKKSIGEDKDAHEDKVAVVIAEGGIETGKGHHGRTIGSNTMMEALRDARNDEDVKAVVLRINSPGGSSLASDEIWREVTLTAAKKPLVVSMSTYAASGGYYIAAAKGVDIVASPITITGSIGVFGVFYDASEFLNDKLGITTDEVKTGIVSSFSSAHPLSKIQQELIQSSIDTIYSTFVSRVDEARKSLNREQVLSIAGGRVWTGLQAKENGLVDALGGYQTAIDLAVKKAKLKAYDLEYYPKEKNALESILEELGVKTSAYLTRFELGEAYPLYKQWERIQSYQGIQTRLPFNLELGYNDASWNAAYAAPSPQDR